MVSGVNIGFDPNEELNKPWETVFEQYLPSRLVNVPWVDSFLRKAKTILIGCQERTRRYQKEFEIASHNLYTQEKNQGNL